MPFKAVKGRFTGILGSVTQFQPALSDCQVMAVRWFQRIHAIRPLPWQEAEH